MRTPLNFRDADASNGIWLLYSEGEGFGNESQAGLIPFQRFFIQVMKEQEAEEKREQMDGGATSRSSSTPNQLNPNYEPGGGGKAIDESTTYYNDGYGPGENPNSGLGEQIQDKLD